MRTPSTRVEDARRSRTWMIVDAQGQPLGRLASQVARVLIGKHNVHYTPHVDTGDFVVVVNARHVALKGGRMQKKMYHRHTGWVGGIKSATAEQMLERKPEDVVKLAVGRMLPKTTLGRQMGRKLKVYADAQHPHEAQRPAPLTLRN